MSEIRRRQKIDEDAKNASSLEIKAKTSNLKTRVVSGLALIAGFTFLIYIGAPGLIFLTYFCAVCTYSELLRLGMKITEKFDHCQYKYQSWAYFALMAYWLNGKALFTYVYNEDVAIVTQHDVIVFCLYTIFTVNFVILLSKESPKEHLKSYGLLAWTHMVLMYTMLPTHLMNVTMLRGGLIRYVLPMSLVTINDIAAYFIGRCFGKTPLIKLSPNKTLEGFLGAGLVTIVTATKLAPWMAQQPYLTCPPLKAASKCSIRPNYNVHGVIIAALCSFIGPFAGFFASGLKRGCGIKNFNESIPGHGGVTDRCDCIIFCAGISYFYHAAFFD